MKKYLYTSILLFIVFSVAAQDNMCGTPVNENYQKSLKASMPEFQSYLKNVALNRNNAKSSHPKNSIALNINIVRDDNGNTPMDTSLIRKGIKYMNEKFADSGLEFYICGNYNYINSTYYYNTNSFRLAAMNNTYGIPDVINVYFVWFIVSGGSAVQGVAPTPGSGDWITLRHNADTTVYAHEMGHFFGLLHTHGLLYDSNNGFYTEEYVDGSNCAETGDYFCDTPADPGLSPAIVNGSNVNAQCNYFGNEKDDHNEVYVPDESNLMSYAPHHCLDHFSAQQSAYMNWAYLNRRANLSCSQLNVDFNYLNTLSCDSPYVYQFQNLSVGLTNLEWDVNDDGITDYTSLNPSHTYASSGTKWISLKGVAGGKTYSRYKTIEILEPVTAPILDDFNNGLLPDGWEILNPDKGRKWEMTEAFGSDGLNSKVWYFDNFDYNGYDEEDYIVTSTYDLTSFQNARLTFDLAYALHNNLDAFYVLISTDCGNTYDSVITYLTGSNLKTHDRQYHKFTPTENDWQSVVIPIDEYVGNFVRFKLVNHNNKGNVLYLDNVKVEGGDSISTEIGWAKTTISTNENSIDGQTDCRGYQIISVPVFISEVPVTNISAQITTSGSATNLLDFEILNPNLVFPSGQKNMQMVQIKIYDDGASEGTETLNLHLNILGVSDFSTTSKNVQCIISIHDNDSHLSKNNFYSEILLNENFNSMIANELPGWQSTVTDPFTATFWISSSFYNFWLNIPNDPNDLTLDSTHYMLVANIQEGNYQYDSAYLITPDLDVQEFDSLVLELDHLYKTLNLYSGDVVIEVWNGHVWVNLFRHTNLEGSFGSHLRPQHAIFNLNSFSNSDFKIRFGIENEINGNYYLLDNVKLTGFKEKAKATVAHKLNTSTEKYLGPNELVYFYDDNTGNILASIQNLSSWAYGCTTILIDREGSGAMPYLSNDIYNYASEKSLLITPSNNNPNGLYEITVYINTAEWVGWQFATGNALNEMSLVKTGGPISNINPSNILANGNTNFEGINTSVQNYLTSSLQISGKFTTGFSGFAIVRNSAMGTLPVEFYADLAGEYVKEIGNVLTWTTATEINNDYFELQLTTDGIFFETVGKINGAGNSSILNSYEFVDKAFYQGNNYYRLKQVDYDGKFSLSKLISINNSPFRNDFKPVVYPNPTNQKLNIQSQTIIKELSIMNIDGRLILNKVVNKSQVSELDVSMLNTGVYYIRMIDFYGNLKVTKFIKQ